MSQEMSPSSITKIDFIYISQKCHENIPGSNELNHQHMVCIPYLVYLICRRARRLLCIWIHMNSNLWYCHWKVPVCFCWSLLNELYVDLIFFSFTSTNFDLLTCRYLEKHSSVKGWKYNNFYQLHLKTSYAKMSAISFRHRCIKCLGEVSHFIAPSFHLHTQRNKKSLYLTTEQLVQCHQNNNTNKNTTFANTYDT